MKRGKRYRELSKLVEKDKVYSVQEAVQLVKKSANAKFDETIELCLRLGIDPKRQDQAVRGTVLLPHGTGKSKVVAVVAKGEKVKEAEEKAATATAGKEFEGNPSKAFAAFLDVNFGHINQIESQQFFELVDTFGDDEVRAAIHEAVSSGKKRAPLKYLRSILERWEREGHEARASPAVRGLPETYSAAPPDWREEK